MRRTDIYIHDAGKPLPPENLRAEYERLETAWRAAGKATKAFERTGLLGLPTEKERNDPAFREAKNQYSAAFQALRNFNAQYANQYNWAKQR